MYMTDVVLEKHENDLEPKWLIDRRNLTFSNERRVQTLKFRLCKLQGRVGLRFATNKTVLLLELNSNRKLEQIFKLSKLFRNRTSLGQTLIIRVRL